MAFEPKYEKVVSSFREKLGTTQVVVDFRLPMNDSVSKVVCASAKAVVSNTEGLGRTLDYNGFVSFQVIYKNQNNEIEGVSYTAEFKDKYESDAEFTGSTPIVTAKVVDIGTNVDNGEVKVTAIIELDIDVIRSSEANALVGVTDMVVRQEDFSYNTYNGMVYDKWEQIHDIEIKDAVKKVLGVGVSTYIEKVEPNDKYLTVKGGLDIEVCYLTDEDVLRSASQNFTFSQEVAGDMLNDLSCVQSILNNDVNDNKITTTIDTDSTVVNVVLPLVYNGYVFNLNTIDVVVDAYSLTNFANFTTNSIETLCCCDSISWEEKINNTLQLDENAPFVDEVLGTCCDNIVVANVTVDENLTVEGVAHTTLVYLNKETSSVNSVEIEIPFSSNVRLPENCEDAQAIVCAGIVNMTGKERRGRDLEVSATLMLYADLYKNREEGLITQVNLEDEMPENECAMSFYITKEGDTVWDIAKEMAITTEDLLAQNPDLSDPIMPGTRVVVYRQRVVEY